MNYLLIILFALWPWDKTEEDTASVICWDTATTFESGIQVRTYRYIYYTNSGTIHLDLFGFWTPAYSYLERRMDAESPLSDLTISFNTKEKRTLITANTLKEGNLLLTLRNDYELSRHDPRWCGLDTVFLLKLWITVADTARAKVIANRWEMEKAGVALKEAEKGEFVNWRSSSRSSSIGYTSTGTMTENEAARLSSPAVEE